MTLQLQPMTLQDFDAILSTPWSPLPESQSEAQKVLATHEERTTVSRYDFLRDPTGRWFKIDSDGELIAYARWHVFDGPEGYQVSIDSMSLGSDVPQLSDGELKGWSRPTDDQSESAALFLKTFREERQRNVGGKKVIILNTLVTSAKYQKRGAGRMLMDEMTREADELGLPVLIEGSEAGLKVYHAIGGVDTGEVIGIPLPDGGEYTRYVMIRQPVAKA